MSDVAASITEIRSRIAAGFDRYEGERNRRRAGDIRPEPLGLQEEEAALGGANDDLDFDDDDFDVPEFLK